MSGTPTKGFERRAVRGGSALVRADLGEIPTDALWAEGEPLAGVRGRSGVHVLELGGVSAVARDYRRGGALAGLLGDRYFDSSRAARELGVLAELRERGLSVVEPLAALSRRAGVGHRLRILTELVPDAKPLPAFAAAHPERRREAVCAAGDVVARAFDAGLVHLDLHADNLLARVAADRVEVLLVDLDRAELRDRLTPRERDAMLLRMARYQYRHAARIPTERTDFVRFLAGMGFDRGARREAVERLAPALRRMLVRHGLA